MSGSLLARLPGGGSARGGLHLRQQKEYTEFPSFGSQVEWARAHFFVYGNGCLRTAARAPETGWFRIAWRWNWIGFATRPSARLARPAWKSSTSSGRSASSGSCGSSSISLRPRAARESKPAGISHSDCEAVSEQLSVLLDVEDLVPGPPYVLEVSSPGLDRKLTKPAEFERFAGRLARISTSEPVENQTYFEGRLAGFADGQRTRSK